jgi:hypothetical protein
MITYNKERNAWIFSEATQDERDALMQMAEAYWSHMMAQGIARQMMKESMEADENDSFAVTVDFHGAH